MVCLPTLPKRGSTVGSSVSEQSSAARRAGQSLLECRVFRVVGILRLLLGVQVVEVAEELVEPVDGGQELVAVAEMVLAELAADITMRLEQLGHRRVFLLQPFVRARQADLGQAGADGRLPGDERGASGGATLLPVPVGEQRAFLGDAVDVRRLVAHHALVVGAEVEPADVVAPDDQDVRFLVLRLQWSACADKRSRGCQQAETVTH